MKTVQSMNLLYENDQLLVLNKTAGCIAEGPPRDGKESLTIQLQNQIGKPVFACHRLDKDTTGVLVFAKNKPCLKSISAQFAERKVRKTYLACVEGLWDPSWNRVVSRIRRGATGKMENSSNGREAITTFRRLAQWSNRSLIEALPKTGRTHQIRLHCLQHQRPILGDRVYGKCGEDQPPLALHAWQLRLKHPATEESFHFTAPLPDYWQDYWLKDCPWKI